MVYAALFSIGFVFFLIQLELSKNFVFTDSNLYLYYADQLSKGAVLYKDLFMTNLPLVPYISVLYKYLTFGSYDGYYMTACIEALASAAVLFLCLRKIYKNDFIGVAGFLFYLTTFLVFSSANHQTGILSAILLFTIAYFCYLSKKYMLTGIFLGLAFCAKAYMLPLIAALLVFAFIKERKARLSLVAGMVGAIALIMLPTVLFASNDFVRQVFGYSLTRSAGFDKWGIIRAFFLDDPLVVLLLIYSITRWQKLFFPALASCFAIIFLLFYKDIYLLYLTMLVPIAVLAFGDVLNIIEKNTKNWGVIVALLSIIILINVCSLIRYTNSIQGFMAIPNIDEFVGIVQKTKPEYLYGEYGIVQGISYLSGIPMVPGVSETNRKLFLSGVLDKNSMTAKIKKNKTTVIAYSIDNDLDIATASAIVNWSLLKDTCKIVYSQNFHTESPINKINIVKCF